MNVVSAHRFQALRPDLQPILQESAMNYLLLAHIRTAAQRPVGGVLHMTDGMALSGPDPGLALWVLRETLNVESTINKILVLS